MGRGDTSKGKGKADGPPGPSPWNRWILLGGLLVLLGFATLGASDYAFAALNVDVTLPADAWNQRYLAISGVYAAGEALVGVGFFLALFGIARRGHA